MKKRWYKISSEKKLGGVCAGLSDMFDVDVTLIRIVWFAAIWTPFPAVLTYLIAWFIIPEKETLHATTASDSSTIHTRTSGNKEFLAG